MEMTNYKQGFQAGLNNWKYDLSKAKSEEYNNGWRDGCEKLKVWDKENG